MEIPATRSGWREPAASCPTLEDYSHSSFSRPVASCPSSISVHATPTSFAFETSCSALYNLGLNSLPDGAPNPPPATAGPRWTIFAAGMLLIALALVVLYTSRGAFFSPLALVVVAAIGLAALLLQLRLRNDIGSPVRAPMWLNVLGLVGAVAAVFADVLHLSASLMLVASLGAVVCFSISGIVVLHALRKQKK